MQLNLPDQFWFMHSGASSYMTSEIILFGFKLAGSVILSTLVVACMSRPFYPLPSKFNDSNKQPLQTFRPYNIAHRGANGELPEETAAAYMVKWADGKRFEDKFVETLMKYGYKGSYMSKDWLSQPVFIQSFAPTSLIYISNVTDSPKILLIDEITIPTQDTNQSYWEITSDTYLDFIKEYVVGIGPWKDTIVPVIGNYLQVPTDLVSRAHAHNLQVHPYTFRNENVYFHFNFDQDPYLEYLFWIYNMGVDGLFTDFAGSLHNFQQHSQA